MSSTESRRQQLTRLPSIEILPVLPTRRRGRSTNLARQGRLTVKQYQAALRKTQREQQSTQAASRGIEQGLVVRSARKTATRQNARQNAVQYQPGRRPTPNPVVGQQAQAAQAKAGVQAGLQRRQAAQQRPANDRGLARQFREALRNMSPDKVTREERKRYEEMPDNLFHVETKHYGIGETGKSKAKIINELLAAKKSEHKEEKAKDKTSLKKTTKAEAKADRDERFRKMRETIDRKDKTGEPRTDEEINRMAAELRGEKKRVVTGKDDEL